MSLTDADRVWYDAGLKFQCTRCGACCTGAPGYVWVNGEEIARLAAYRRDFPLQRFAQEASVVRIEALLAQSDRAGAEGVAREFLEAHPGSPHAGRVRRLMGW